MLSTVIADVLVFLVGRLVLKCVIVRWRFNDKGSAFLYVAEVQSLAMLEVIARPGWSTVAEITVAAIEIPDGSVVCLNDLGLLLPTN